MEKCGYRTVIASSARRYFCSIDVNLTTPPGESIRILMEMMRWGEQCISDGCCFGQRRGVGCDRLAGCTGTSSAESSGGNR